MYLFVNRRYINDLWLRKTVAGFLCYALVILIIYYRDLVLCCGRRAHHEQEDRTDDSCSDSSREAFDSTLESLGCLVRYDEPDPEYDEPVCGHESPVESVYDMSSDESIII